MFDSRLVAVGQGKQSWSLCFFVSVKDLSVRNGPSFSMMILKSAFVATG